LEVRLLCGGRVEVEPLEAPGAEDVVGEGAERWQDEVFGCEGSSGRATYRQCWMRKQ
jgi:hypothetical protein